MIIVVRVIFVLKHTFAYPFKEVDGLKKYCSSQKAEFSLYFLNHTIANQPMNVWDIT